MKKGTDETNGATLFIRVPPTALKSFNVLRAQRGETQRETLTWLITLGEDLMRAQEELLQRIDEDRCKDNDAYNDLLARASEGMKP